MTFMTFPTLSDLDLFTGITYWLTGGQDEFLLFKQYNLKGGKVWEGWKGDGKGFGKWVEPTDLPTPQYFIAYT